MYKMSKVFSFHISKEERDAIEVLRKNDININLNDNCGGKFMDVLRRGDLKFKKMDG